MISRFAMGMKKYLIMKGLDAFLICQIYGLIIHIDQGFQFTGGRFQALLKNQGTVYNESRKGGFPLFYIRILIK